MIIGFICFLPPSPLLLLLLLHPSRHLMPLMHPVFAAAAADVDAQSACVHGCACVLSFPSLLSSSLIASCCLVSDAAMLLLRS